MMQELIAKAAHLLSKGEVIAIPTETVYGLAANAYNDDAVKQIFEIKQRQVHREKTHQKTIGGETKPKLNIRIR